MMDLFLESLFPRLAGTEYEITSPRTIEYNCVAWAADNCSKWWWPDPFGQYFWPSGVPREISVESFVWAFRREGYEPCGSLELEPEYDKVAILVSGSGQPTHMVRQLDNGAWTSKLGRLEDITHSDARDVEGTEYGKIVEVLRRKRRVAATISEARD